MPVSNYVIRQYTPPTCRLEILAQSSALSRWTGKSVLKQLRFELRFDDPQIPEEQRIAIRGDRDQLEALCVAVTNYVQEFLQQSAQNVWANISEPKSSNVSDDSSARNLKETDDRTNTLKSFNTPMLGSDISIQPNSRLTHKLFLGSLANHLSGPVIQLSLLQLFDLATALDEYSTDVLALPTLNTQSTAPSLATWASVAAVLVVGLALTPITWQYANRQRQLQVAKKPTRIPEQVALNPAKPSLQPTPIPSLTVPDSLPSLPQIPISANPPSPSVTSSTSGIIGSISTLSTPSATSLKSTLPSPSNQISNYTTTPKKSPSAGTTFTIPGNSTISQPLPTAPLSTISKLPNQPVNIQPSVGQKTTGLITKNGSVPGTSTSLSNSRTATATTPSISIGTPSVAPPLTTIPELNSDISRYGTGADPLISKLRNARKTSTNVATTTGTLFDATPQVGEAREFLKKHWSPPEGLSQTIQYSLLVGVDGTIERIFPLNKAARDYIDRTGMPLIGERFISPNRNGQPVKIRAVYSPDGKVQTFAEKD